MPLTGAVPVAVVGAKGKTMAVQNGAGIGQFLRALTMGPAMRQQAARRGRLEAHEEMLTEAQAYEGREKAKRALGENQGLAQIEQALVPLVGADMARAASAGAYGKYDIRQATGAASDAQKQLLERQARDALLSGDFQAANASLAAISGQPLKTSSIVGDTVLNEYGPTDQALRTTALGQAKIGAQNASAAASYASAENSRASAAKNRAETAGPGKPVPFQIDGTTLSLFQKPATDATGKPISNPMTGKVEMVPDTERIGAAMSYMAGRHRADPTQSTDRYLADFLGGGEQRAQELQAEIIKARELIRAQPALKAEILNRFRQAGHEGAASLLESE